MKVFRIFEGFFEEFGGSDRGKDGGLNLIKGFHKALKGNLRE